MDQPTTILDYRAYLLRCWNQAGQWRYSLEKVGTSHRQGFASLSALVSYLRQLESWDSFDGGRDAS